MSHYQQSGEDRRFEDLMKKYFETCFKCKKKHGSNFDGGERVILSANNVGKKWVLLCNKCGFEMVKNQLRAPIHIGNYSNQNRKDEILKSFGLKQETLF